MIEIGGTPGIAAVAALVGISFCSFLMGVVFRKWPEQVQDLVETIDGSTSVLPPETHRTLIETGGLALIVLSFVALIAAGYMLH